VLAGPTIRRRRLGTDLRRLREARSLKLEEVAVHLGVAPSTLSRIETGKAPTRTSYLAVMLDLYGVTDASQRALLADLAREGQRRGWWWEYEDLLPAGSGTYLGLEAEACTLRAFEVQLIPELLQTPDYARAVIAAGRPELPALQAERLAGVQMRRQEVLSGQDPLRLRLILDESALLRSVGPSGMMRQQLTQLAELAEAGASVTVQVLPLAAAERLVLSGSFGILSFAEPKDADVLCASGLRGQILLEEREADVHAMRLMFDALSLSALTPAASAGLIRDLASRPLG
jgi:transcriptional regulator with XRE-family HTH domain